MAKKDKAPATPKPKISQGMKIAGSTGGSVGKKELQALSKASDRSGAQLIQKLDELNANLKEKGKVGINLSSGAANMLIRQASKAAPTYDNFLGLGKSTFGTGKIGQALQGMVGTRATGGYINPQSGQQSITPGKELTLLTRGMDLMPGGRQTVRGVGKQFEYTPGNRNRNRNKGPYDGMMNTTGNDQGPPPPPPGDDIAQIDTTLPKPPPEEEKAPQFGAGISEALANWATGFKAARSSRKRAGRGAQTLSGTTRMIPTGGFRGGV